MLYSPGPDQSRNFVGSDLVLNCLQWPLADDISGKFKCLRLQLYIIILSRLLTVYKWSISLTLLSRGSLVVVSVPFS